MLVNSIFSVSNNVFKRLLSQALFCKGLTLSKMTNFRLYYMKEFADDNFKLDENGRKLSKWVENTAGKGEIARYEQFLLFPQHFQRLALQTRKNQGLFGKGLSKILFQSLTFLFTFPYTSGKAFSQSSFFLVLSYREWSNISRNSSYVR